MNKRSPETKVELDGRLAIAFRLARTVRDLETLMAGESVSTDRLDPAWLRYYEERGLWQK